MSGKNLWKWHRGQCLNFIFFCWGKLGEEIERSLHLRHSAAQEGHRNRKEIIALHGK